MHRAKRRAWVPERCETQIQSLAATVAAQTVADIERSLLASVENNRKIHEQDCINLNPATNVMNPNAERLLAAGISSRPSLGYPGDKYEMGLEAIERIEVFAMELAAEVFNASFAEIRVPSGALANLYVFMSVAKPGDVIIAPPTEIGGHVTHHGAGAAGLYGLTTYPAPIDARNYTVDIPKLRAHAQDLRPKLITIGSSLNLFPHPIGEIRAIADEVGAFVLFDGAHLSGMIAGRAWQQPLEEGAHVMTMSTYKSLGGPAAGLIVTNEPRIAQQLDAIAFPGLTANFDAGKSAALAMTLLDWKTYGSEYAKAMADTARALAAELIRRGLPVFARERGGTTSHQFAIEAGPYGGGQTASKRLRQANILACGIGLPIPEVAGDLNGLRLGTPEIVRWGMGPTEMPAVAAFIADALTGARDLKAIAADVSEFRRQFTKIHFIR
ncbi:MAG TPA: aminotransferase class I/II-fold pyridoxal phosphate-dependent enzyme [Candidatus Baltobacteraceae bacterium]|nr:aminotransferase class I/II-fold pyridoxal phosphate-dependent enzyme [Candidatus Baltobacteraceae bacterium]